jgi:hypothetical protein
VDAEARHLRREVRDVAITRSGVAGPESLRVGMVGGLLMEE